MVIASLRKLGDVEFDGANNGLEAIERLALAKVNLIFLDLNMPDIHGVEVIEFVRERELSVQLEERERLLASSPHGNWPRRPTASRMNFWLPDLTRYGRRSTRSEVGAFSCVGDRSTPRRSTMRSIRSTETSSLNLRSSKTCWISREW
jgi:hypothetical protein